MGKEILRTPKTITVSSVPSTSSNALFFVVVGASLSALAQVAVRLIRKVGLSRKHGRRGGAHWVNWHDRFDHRQSLGLRLAGFLSPMIFSLKGHSRLGTDSVISFLPQRASGKMTKPPSAFSSLSCLASRIRDRLAPGAPPTRAAAAPPCTRPAEPSTSTSSFTTPRRVMYGIGYATGNQC